MTRSHALILWTSNKLRSKTSILLIAGFIVSAAVLLMAPQVAMAQCTGLPETGGNDTITCSNNNTGTSIAANTGDDSITNNGGSTIDDIRGNVGNDTIVNNGSALSLIGNENEDVVINNGTAVGISGGTMDAGNDTLINTGTLSQSIIAGDGNDSVVNSGTLRSTTTGAAIDTGAGNDLVELLAGTNLNGQPINDAADLGFDRLFFNFTLNFNEANSAELTSFNFIVAASGGCFIPDFADDCTGSITASGITYTYNNWAQLLFAATILIPAPPPGGGGGGGGAGGGGGELVSIQITQLPFRLIFDDGFVKIFQLDSGELDVYSGFVEGNPNGFLVGRIVPGQVSGSECIRFQDPGPHPAWYVLVCPADNGRWWIRVFDETDTLLREYYDWTFSVQGITNSLNGGGGTVTAFTEEGLPFQVPVGFTANPSVHPGERAFATGNVNIRTEPSLLAGLTGQQIGWGIEVTVLLQDPTGYWFYVRTDDGLEGWVANEWFAPIGAIVPRVEGITANPSESQVASAEGTTDAPVDAESTTDTAVDAEAPVDGETTTDFTANPDVRPGEPAMAVGSVRLRGVPSLNSDQVGELAWGTQVTVLAEDKSGYWFLVQSGDVTGWAANEWFAPAR